MTAATKKKTAAKPKRESAAITKSDIAKMRKEMEKIQQELDELRLHGSVSPNRLNETDRAVEDTNSRIADVEGFARTEFRDIRRESGRISEEIETFRVGTDDSIHDINERAQEHSDRISEAFSDIASMGGQISVLADESATMRDRINALDMAVNETIGEERERTDKAVKGCIDIVDANMKAVSDAITKSHADCIETVNGNIESSHRYVEESAASVRRDVDAKVSEVERELEKKSVGLRDLEGKLREAREKAAEQSEELRAVRGENTAMRRDHQVLTAVALLCVAGVIIALAKAFT